MRGMNGRRIGASVLGLVAAGALFAGCSEPTQQDMDAQRSQDNINALVANQPVAVGQYSPTREQINNWNRTWQSGPGKLAYTYLFVNGQPIGYYVLIGPPVSYAANATQTSRIECTGSGCGVLPNAGQDGAFYNQGSGQFQFYGKDATTGRQLEWGGPTMSYLLSDQPLRLSVPPLGDTVIPEQ